MVRQETSRRRNTARRWHGRFHDPYPCILPSRNGYQHRYQQHQLLAGYGGIQAHLESAYSKQQARHRREVEVQKDVDRNLWFARWFLQGNRCIHQEEREEHQRREDLSLHVPRLQSGLDDAHRQLDAMEVPLAGYIQETPPWHDREDRTRHPHQAKLEGRKCTQDLCGYPQVPARFGLFRALD